MILNNVRFLGSVYKLRNALPGGWIYLKRYSVLQGGWVVQL